MKVNKIPAKTKAEFIVNFLILFFITTVILSVINWETDDSDVDFWNRSGFSVHTDNKTGLQYISVPFGGITPRLNVDGTHMRKER